MNSSARLLSTRAVRVPERFALTSEAEVVIRGKLGLKRNEKLQFLINDKGNWEAWSSDKKTKLAITSNDSNVLQYKLESWDLSLQKSVGATLGAGTSRTGNKRDHEGGFKLGGEGHLGQRVSETGTIHPNGSGSGDRATLTGPQAELKAELGSDTGVGASASAISATREKFNRAAVVAENDGSSSYREYQFGIGADLGVGGALARDKVKLKAGLAVTAGAPKTEVDAPASVYADVRKKQVEERITELRQTAAEDTAAAERLAKNETLGLGFDDTLKSVRATELKGLEAELDRLDRGVTPVPPQAIRELEEIEKSIAEEDAFIANRRQILERNAQSGIEGPVRDINDKAQRKFIEEAEQRKQALTLKKSALAEEINEAETQQQLYQVNKDFADGKLPSFLPPEQQQYLDKLQQEIQPQSPKSAAPTIEFLGDGSDASVKRVSALEVAATENSKWLNPGGDGSLLRDGPTYGKWGGGGWAGGDRDSTPVCKIDWEAPVDQLDEVFKLHDYDYMRHGLGADTPQSNPFKQEADLKMLERLRAIPDSELSPEALLFKTNAELFFGEKTSGSYDPELVEKLRNIPYSDLEWEEKFAKFAAQNYAGANLLKDDLVKTASDLYDSASDAAGKAIDSIGENLNEAAGWAQRMAGELEKGVQSGYDELASNISSFFGLSPEPSDPGDGGDGVVDPLNGSVPANNADKSLSAISDEADDQMDSAEGSADRAEGAARRAESALRRALRARARILARLRRSGCWVAREVYGQSDPRWRIFRSWLLAEAPAWLRYAYLVHGERSARLLHRHRFMVPLLRWWMDRVVMRQVHLLCNAKTDPLRKRRGLRFLADFKVPMEPS